MGFKPVEFVDGFSTSAWKSLLVKSLRIGWVTGMAQASERLGWSTVQQLLLCGVFEDIFPEVYELADVLAEAKAGDFAALCRRQTHHGRGLSDKFCDLEHEAVDMAENHKGDVWEVARRFNLWLPNRALNCFWTWQKIKPLDAGIRRMEIDNLWTGMPTMILDGHTYEGKRDYILVTPLSGHYPNHRALGKRVMSEGWGPVRAEALADIAEGCKTHAKQGRLF